MARQFRGENRKSWVTRSISATLLLVTLVFGFLIMNGEFTQRSRVVKPTVALVNEDLAADFNNKVYAFGTNFVDRVSKDAEYNWTVVSRPVAEKAYKDGSVDAAIYLPQSFSHDILTLHDLDPTKATIEYRLRPQADEQSDRLLKSKIVDIVYGFNRSVVKMYYASVADNVAEADGYMNASLGNQEALIAALTSDVEEPLSETMPSFRDFVSRTTGLKDVNASTVEAQNSLSETITESLTRTSDSFSGTLFEIDDHASRQREIAQINATNSNTRIADQAASDREFYGSQFDGMRTSILCKLSGVDATDAEDPCKDADGVVPSPLSAKLDSLRQSIADYSTDYSGSVGSLQSSILTMQTSLDASIANLEALAALIDPSGGPAVPQVPAAPRVSVPSVPLDPAAPIAPGSPAVHPAALAMLRADIDVLRNVRDALNVDGLPGLSFGTQLESLDLWLNETRMAVTETTLETSTVRGLEVKDWISYDPDRADVYVDNSDELYRSISGLVTQTAETSGQIASNTMNVPDSLLLFEALLNSATATYSGAEIVHNGVRTMLTDGDTELSRSQLFYRNFSTVLANTRAQGVDIGKIHDFFSAPIDAKDITPERVTASSAFDSRWLIGFPAGLIAGILVAALSRTFPTKKRA